MMKSAKRKAGKMPTKTPDINTQMRELEKSKTLTVIDDNPGNTLCQKCGERGLTFCCHLFREPPAGKIEELCKPCAIQRAGGEEKVYVRSGEYLRRKWDAGKRGNVPECLSDPDQRRSAAKDDSQDLGSLGGASGP